MGLRQAAPVHPDPAGEDRPAARRHPRPAYRDRADRAAGERLLLRALPRPAPAARSHPLGRSRGAPDRRGRPRGRGPGGGPARDARRVSGIGAGDRHVRGPAPAVRHPHLEQHPRPVRRAQAPLPAPVSRLPERRTRARDPAEQEDRPARRGRRAPRPDRPRAARARPPQGAQHLGDRGLGPDAGGARRRGNRPGRPRRHDLGGGEVLARRPARAGCAAVPGRPERRPGRRPRTRPPARP